MKTEGRPPAGADFRIRARTNETLYILLPVVYSITNTSSSPFSPCRHIAVG